MADTDVKRLKRALRGTFLEKRSALDELAREAAQRDIAAHFFEDIELRPDDCIAGYWPVQAEVDVRPILTRLGEKGHDCALPAILAQGAPLGFRLWRDGDMLEERMYGIPEPLVAAGAVIPTLLLVPLLAWDARGHRLGYGGGYYDRTIAQLRAENPALRAYGCGFACQRMDDILPAGEHDMTLDGVIHENGFETFGT